MHYYIIVFPWILLTACVAFAFQIYVMVLAILAAPVLIIVILTEEVSNAKYDIE